MAVINKSQCIKRLTQLCKPTGSVYPLSRSNHLRLRSLRIITSNPSSGQAAFTLLWWHLQAPAASLAPRLLWEAHLPCESHRLSFFLVENDWRRWMAILCLGQRSSLVYCCMNLIFFLNFAFSVNQKGLLSHVSLWAFRGKGLQLVSNFIRVKMSFNLFFLHINYLLRLKET